MSSEAGNKVTMHVNGVPLRLYNYGSEIAVTIDIMEDSTQHLIQAIKLEAGSSQSLATNLNGVWVLNNQMDRIGDTIKIEVTTYDIN
jgi:hypothetical protein